jgi:hypothetical protein
MTVNAEYKMGIKRPTYLKQLQIRENNGFVKIITDMRRFVGIVSM